MTLYLDVVVADNPQNYEDSAIENESRLNRNIQETTGLELQLCKIEFANAYTNFKVYSDRYFWHTRLGQMVVEYDIIDN